MKRVYCEDDGLTWAYYCPVHHKPTVTQWLRGFLIYRIILGKKLLDKFKGID